MVFGLFSSSQQTHELVPSRPSAVAPDALAIPALNKLANKRVILASSSPRRKEILQTIGLNPEIVPSTFAEDLPKDDFIDNTYAYPLATASEKAREVYERLLTENEADSPDLVISADTVVILPDAGSLTKGAAGETDTPDSSAILEKPVDAEDQMRMLMDYNGRAVEVVTAVVLVYPIITAPGYATKSFASKTLVHFFDNELSTLKAYVDSGEGLDRAGGFSIQGYGSLLIRGMEGDYNNVVGFPAAEFVRFMDDLLEEDDGFLEV